MRGCLGSKWGVGGEGGGYKNGSGGCGGTACCTQVLELLECIPPLLLLLVACGLDHALSSALSVIRQHSFVQYSFRSELQPHSTPGWGGLGKGEGGGGDRGGFRMERGPPPPPPHYLPAGSHHLSVHVMGTSLMARLLRSTVGSLNSSSDTELETSNFGVRLWGERWGVGGTGGTL